MSDPTPNPMTTLALALEKEIQDWNKSRSSLERTVSTLSIRVQDLLSSVGHLLAEHREISEKSRSCLATLHSVTARVDGIARVLADHDPKIAAHQEAIAECQTTSRLLRAALADLATGSIPADLILEQTRTDGSTPVPPPESGACSRSPDHAPESETRAPEPNKRAPKRKSRAPGKNSQKDAPRS